MYACIFLSLLNVNKQINQIIRIIWEAAADAKVLFIG
jgi:hypothetical protein